MLNVNVRDGLLFTDKKSGETAIFNYNTFCQIIIGCMIRYGNLVEEEAYARLAKSTIITQPPSSYSDVVFLTHEYEFHWAMILVYGENYWSTSQNVDSNLPKDYNEWEANYIEENHLESVSYEYQ